MDDFEVGVAGVSSGSIIYDAIVERMREFEREAIAKRVAAEVASVLGSRVILGATDVASRSGREEELWRDERRSRSESWDRIETEESGESSMSDVEASELLKSLRRRQARRAVTALKKRLGLGLDYTIEDALKAYEKHLREKGNKENSIGQTLLKLRRFFSDVELEVARVSPRIGQQYYDALRRSKRKDGELVSVDYHRNALAEAKTFLKWCVKKNWVPANALEKVEGVGRRKHGKPQLRIDEARLWIAKAIEHAGRGEPGAVAALMTLLMGMRATEIISRVVRDLDDDGRLLWIPDAKTAKGRRAVQVPELLRPYFQELCKDKTPAAKVFGEHWRDWPCAWVQRICRQAEVPEVSAHSMHARVALDVGSRKR